ncbi:MAG: ABC transporter ATP-binding protein [Coriobacteriaceae bacterium]|nr:ABC transporter ATP-binding protein [Coriobacteriaceae bacterium]
MTNGKDSRLDISPDAPALRVTGIEKRFGARRVLKSVDFELPQGASLVIFGPNGAGKTTLLRILSTLDRPSKGTCEALGLSYKEQVDEVRGCIGFITHNPMLYLDLTARENLVLFARLYGVDDPDKAANEMLSLVELKHRANDKVRGFSRGMTQRIAIARAFINDPRIVFLDEPYSGLDPHAAGIVDRMLAESRQRRTLVTVSHSLESGFAQASHVLLLAKGRQVLFSQQSQLEYDEFKNVYYEQVGVGA